MAIPQVNFQQQSSTVVQAQNPVGSLLLVGTALTVPPGIGQSGTGYDMFFGVGNQSALTAAFTTGPLVDAGGLMLLAMAKGGISGTVFCVNIFSGSVTANLVHVGSGSPSATASGSPMGAYNAPDSVGGAGHNGILFKITTGGALGTMQFTYQLTSGGQVFGPFTSLASGLFSPPNTGVTVTFGSGTYVLADNYTVLVTQSTGSAGSVTSTVTGTGTMTAAGSTPTDAYSVVVKIVVGYTSANPNNGKLGNAMFQYSLDGGLTFSNTITVPSGGTYSALQSTLGLTFVFAVPSGNGFIAGDTFSFSCTAPSFGTTDLSNLYTSLSVQSLTQTEGSWIIGMSSSASAFATLISSLDSIAQSLYANAVYHFFVCEGPTDTTQNNQDQTIITALATTTSDYVVGCVGDINITSPVTLTEIERTCAWAVGPRIGQTRFGRDLAAVADGGCINVANILRDENATPALDAAHLASMRQISGFVGFFITNPNIIAGPASVFQLLQYRRVMNAAIRAVRPVLISFLSLDVRVNADGTINNDDATALEKQANTALTNAIVSTGDASGASTQIDRTTNVLATSTLTWTITITAKAYVKQQTVKIGFSPGTP